MMVVRSVSMVDHKNRQRQSPKWMVHVHKRDKSSTGPCHHAEVAYMTLEQVESSLFV